ncbi:MAG: c-type cytochrome biogenesis protein CcsB [Nitrospirota bacterium]|nr:c-type cytochrome biogenesis protein CcsB [Nitrospirota bacterium]
MESLFFKLALIGYAIGTLKGLLYLAKSRAFFGSVYLIASSVGFAFHTLALIAMTVNKGYLPVTDLHGAMSLFSWAIVMIFLIVEYRYRILVLGSFILPLAFIAIFSAAMAPPKTAGLPPALDSAWFLVHIGFAMLGAAAFTLSFAVSVMYLIQEWNVKHHKAGLMFQRLPSLEIMDEMNYRLISLGFIPLTLGILSGSIWAEYVWGAFWSWDPKQTWSLITWFVYAALLHGRLTIGWRGRKAAIIAIIGFMAVIFTFLGVNLLLGGKHTFQ